MNSTNKFALVSMVAEAARFLRYDPAGQVLYTESRRDELSERLAKTRQGKLTHENKS